MQGRSSDAPSHSRGGGGGGGVPSSEPPSRSHATETGAKRRLNETYSSVQSQWIGHETLPNKEVNKGLCKRGNIVAETCFPKYFPFWAHAKHSLLKHFLLPRKKNVSNFSRNISFSQQMFPGSFPRRGNNVDYL